MKLTILEIKKATAEEKPFKLSDGNGLYLLVKSSGKYWRMNYRYNGKQKTLYIGVFPAMTLAQAREKAIEAKSQLTNNIDPQADKQEKKILKSIQTENTFQAIAEEWFDNNVHKWADNYSGRVMGMLKMHAFDTLGPLPITEIKPQVVLSVIRTIEKGGIHETAHRCTQYINAIFRYAIITGRCDYNPAADLRGALKPVIQGHFTALDIKDLPSFWNDLNENGANMYDQTQISIKIMIYTFVRTAELINAPWSEIDFDAKQWIIPKTRMKMKRDHVVPLSDQVIALLHQLHNINGKRAFLFPSVSRPNQPMSNNAILAAIKRMGYKDKTTGHGFRAMASTNMYEREMARQDVIEKQLAHEEGNKIKAAYNRAQYMPERTKLMQDWADYVDGVVGENNSQ
jgi:integrase